MTPIYYKELVLTNRGISDSAFVTKPSMWFILDEKLKTTSLSGLRLVSNGRKLADVLKAHPHPTHVGQQCNKA